MLDHKEKAPGPAYDGIFPAELQGLSDAVLSGLAGERLGTIDLEKAPVLPSLMKTMDVDLVAGGKGKAMLCYTKRLPDHIWWAEYDPELAQLSFVTVNGQILPFGAKIHPEIHRLLKSARDIVLMQVNDDGSIADAAERRLVVRRGFDQTVDVNKTYKRGV